MINKYNDVIIGSDLCVHCFYAMKSISWHKDKGFDFETVACSSCGRWELRRISHKTGKIKTDVWSKGDQKSPF